MLLFSLPLSPTTGNLANHLFKVYTWQYEQYQKPMNIRRPLTVFCVVHSVCGWENGVLHKLQSFISNLYSHWLLSVGHSSFVAEEASGSLHIAHSYGFPVTCDVDCSSTHLVLFAVHLPGGDSENHIFKSSMAF